MNWDVIFDSFERWLNNRDHEFCWVDHLNQDEQLSDLMGDVVDDFIDVKKYKNPRLMFEELINAIPIRDAIIKWCEKNGVKFEELREQRERDKKV